MIQHGVVVKCVHVSVCVCTCNSVRHLCMTVIYMYVHMCVVCMHLCNAVCMVCVHVCTCKLFCRFVGKLYHVVITHAAVYVTQGPVEIVQGKECGIVHAARQVNLSTVCNLFFLCHSYVGHVLPCTEDIPVCGDTCSKVCNSS